MSRSIHSSYKCSGQNGMKKCISDSSHNLYKINFCICYKFNFCISTDFACSVPKGLCKCWQYTENSTEKV